MYEIISQSIPQARRAEINEKSSPTSNPAKQNSRQTIYNCYTGVGGLHDLNPDQFANYHEYACAKREFEQGQFFTPHALCRQIVSLAASDPTETVLDMGCGMGNFFNFLPNLHNAYGFDIDPRAVKVAGYLYPEAHISVQDMQQYEPAMLFDLLLGNPPFNLKFGNDSSQFYYFRKAYSVLKPAGLLLCIVPCSFLQSEFWDKSQIRYIDNCFSFLGQTKLPQDTFEDLGVAEFATKLVVFSPGIRTYRKPPVSGGRIYYAGTASRADRTLPGNQMFPETEITTGNKPRRTRRRASIRIQDDEVSV